MRCPYCTALESRVVDSRLAGDGTVTWRRRECDACKKRFTTYERVEHALPLVSKRDGKREPFDRQKLLGSLRIACSKRPVSVDTLVVRADNPLTGDSELTAVEELRIGSLDGPEETSFGYIDAIAVALEGTVYVADIQVPSVRVFDPDGGYLGDLGQKGEGPGEYVAIRGIAALPDGGVAVWHEMGDISVFDRNRQFVRRFSVRVSSIAGGAGPEVHRWTSGSSVACRAEGTP